MGLQCNAFMSKISKTCCAVSELLKGGCVLFFALYLGAIGGDPQQGGSPSGLISYATIHSNLFNKNNLIFTLRLLYDLSICDY